MVLAGEPTQHGPEDERGASNEHHFTEPLVPAVVGASSFDHCALRLASLRASRPLATEYEIASTTLRIVSSALANGRGQGLDGNRR